MTEIAEPVEFGEVLGEDVSCPFDHDSSKPEEINNKLVGNGGTLGDNMTAGSSTVLYVPMRKPQSPVPNPDLDVGDTPIDIGEWLYPVSCAAHHLIPAQASLKKATKLLKFMKKGGRKPNKFWSDIGYDVNGIENGVWLPGNYAVGGNGTGDWVGAPSAFDGDSELASVRKRAARRSSASSKLDGVRHEIDPKNRKWLYVDQATRLFNAQFHDAHVDYNKFVLRVLNKIGEKMQDARKKSIDNLACPKCKKRQDKIAEYGVPPPYSLNERLNGVSGRLRNYLKGCRGHSVVYTSRWGKLIGDQKT
jgi:hypothetical protein